MSTSCTDKVEPTQPEGKVFDSPDKVTCDAGSGNGNEVEGPNSPEKAAHEGGTQVEVEVPVNKEEARTKQGSQPEVDNPDEEITDDRLEVDKSFVMCLHLMQSSVWN